MNRDTLMLNALEDIAEATSQRGVIDNAVRMSNIILKIEAIASVTLKRLEKGV